eukprot:TRINITY_DN48130_c0_g1_i1.p1 TRINITY_DN48130_c0_g1~~TRINITY_DN48130_c0_g1_i1.p1  ORF type:complete len:1108 (+),score=142.18 TRINITY_DN48130_c0_g1_i1:88-3324(+)
MTNREVAEALLSKGLHGFGGVVFLNEKDERVVLERLGLRVVQLAQCGLPPEQRFTFYDHVHATGIDIKQPLACAACITLSKDITFRDYAQGAYRMRGLGRGQRLDLLLIPEVSALMQQVLSRTDPKGRSANSGKAQSGLAASTRRTLADVIAWTLLNSASSEDRKRRLLYQQEMRNVWRCAASTWLQQKEIDTISFLDHTRTKLALSELCTTLDFSIAPLSDAETETGLAESLKRELALREEVPIDQSLWESEQTRKDALHHARRIIEAAVAQSKFSLGDNPPGMLSLGSEHVQEQEEEQEAEDEREQEVEVEEEAERHEAAVEQRYSRDGEACQPWPLRTLTEAPSTAKSSGPPFYPLAEFSVNNGILGQACEPLEGLPSYTFLSENHYRRSWSLTGKRRLRNVICFLEWVPDVSALKRLRMPSNAELTSEQRAQLREVFKLYGKGDSKSIDNHELLMLFRALDLDLEGQAAASCVTKGKLTFEQIEEDVSSHAFYKMQQGRYFVALSLEEAEHLRASMHLLGSQSWPSKCGFALRCIGNKEAGIGDSLLDSFGPVHDSVELRYQLETAEHVFRFFNCAEDFQARELNILLRAMQPTIVKDRLPWWLEARSCRRRDQRQWQRLPVAKVFVEADKHRDLPTLALLSRVRWALAIQGLSPADAFRLLDASRSNVLRRADFASNLERLGLKGSTAGDPARWKLQADSLFRYLDKDSNDLVDLDEFRTEMELDAADWECVPAFAKRRQGPDLQTRDTHDFKLVHERGRGDEAESRSIKANKRTDKKAGVVSGRLLGQSDQGYASEQKVDFNSIGTRQNAANGVSGAMPATTIAVTSLSKHEGQICSMICSPELFKKLQTGRFKLKQQRHSAFSPIWAETKPTPAAGDLLSIWSPAKVVPRGKLQGFRKGSNAVKERLVFGSYVTASLGAPQSVSLLEVTDEKESGIFAKHRREELGRFLDFYFPHPSSFRLVWANHSGRPLYLWEPQAPSEIFGALGVLATSGPETPCTSEVRCAPRAWITPFSAGIVNTLARLADGNGDDASVCLGIGREGVLLRLALQSDSSVIAGTVGSEKFYASMSQ